MQFLKNKKNFFLISFWRLINITVLFKKLIECLQCVIKINSPPKPHAFVSLPIQTSSFLSSLIEKIRTIPEKFLKNKVLIISAASIGIIHKILPKLLGTELG